jgi:hypothetical protein
VRVGLLHERKKRGIDRLVRGHVRQSAPAR